MDSLHLLTLQLIIAKYLVFGGPIEEEQGLKPCPNIKPFAGINIDQVKIWGKLYYIR